MINYSSRTITPELAEWHAQIEKATMELVKKHLIARHDLTEEQLADAIAQALLAGDFQKLVVASSGAQCVTYIPFAREQELESKIGRMKPVVEVADALEAYLGANSGTTADWPVEINADEDGAAKVCELLNALKQALKPIRELREAGRADT
jgi:hypothetical protein